MKSPYQSLIDSALALQRQQEGSLPPIDSWQPPLSGDMPVLIQRDGRWFHQGAPIERQALIRLFASILKREGDEYFLVTPVEKWRIQVEDVPFQVVFLEVLAEGSPEQALCLRTNMGDQVVASSANPLRVISDNRSGEPSPYLLVRHNLEGRLSRAVYYELAELAQRYPLVKNKCHGVISRGIFFSLQ
ncbi:DUF1285 domain-containing protein [Porticoccus sp.]